jgi:hypothetical protein
MWDVYAPGGAGIALKSTIARLRDSLGHYAEPYYVGQVKYIDYETGTLDLSSVFHALLTKRLSFDHEHEIRALICDWEPIAHVIREECWQRIR